MNVYSILDIMNIYRIKHFFLGNMVIYEGPIDSIGPRAISLGQERKQLFSSNTDVRLFLYDEM